VQEPLTSFDFDVAATRRILAIQAGPTVLVGHIAGADRIINPDLERWYAWRAKSNISEIAGASHSVYETHPKEVAMVIEKAAQVASKQGQANSAPGSDRLPLSR
jgi:pimeloyl-ACP methyl ester carboxylesterase